jgi:hypothetical protein
MMFDKILIALSKRFSIVPRVDIHLKELVDISTGLFPPITITHITKDYGVVASLDQCKGHGDWLGANCRIIQKVLNKHFDINTLYQVDITKVKKTMNGRKDCEIVLRTGTGYIVANFIFNKGWVVNE